MGSLFMKNFNRIRVEDDNYLLNLVQYIHQNPVEAKLCRRAIEWEHSSYKEIVANDNSFVESQKVIEWHGDLAKFVHCHSHLQETDVDEMARYIL